MSLIITHPTDQYKVKYGYCTRCFAYNEVWRTEKTSKCSCCGRKMIHISSWKIWLVVSASLLFLLNWLYGSQINVVKDMKDKILEIAEQLKYDEITTDYAQNLLLGLFGVSGSWVYVNEETPPSDIELLAKAPDGTIHLTSWRPAYDIFCCQCKSESAFDWQWKLV